MSFGKLYSFKDESDNEGSGSWSPGTCAFPFFSGKSIGSVVKSVGRVHDIGSGIFVSIGIKSISDVVLLVVFVPIGVKSKHGQLI